GHGERVHSGVRTASGMHGGNLAGHPVDRVLERLLDRGPVVLPLPTHERAAVIFDGQPPTGHDVRRLSGLSCAPIGIGKPRRSSSGVIRDRPARWTTSGLNARSPHAILR